MELFNRLREVIEILRGENGCPWDREQTHETLKPNMIEEVHEAIEAIELKDPVKLSEELGDLLVLVMLHAQIASDNGDFTIDDVIATLTDKIIRRHPHVFGNLEVKSSDEVLENWEAIKQNEHNHRHRNSELDGVPINLPSLQFAQKIQKKASRVGFDWRHATDLIPKLKEEIGELEVALSNENLDELAMEMGDLFFTMVNLCRFLGVQAEEALRKSNRKFIDRFKEMENELEKRGKKFSDYGLSELDDIWEKIKKRM